MRRHSKCFDCSLHFSKQKYPFSSFEDGATRSWIGGWGDGGGWKKQGVPTCFQSCFVNSSVPHQQFLMNAAGYASSQGSLVFLYNKIKKTLTLRRQNRPAAGIHVSTFRTNSTERHTRDFCRVLGGAGH